MIIVVNDGGNTSIKTRFVIKIFEENCDQPFFYIFRKKTKKEKWTTDYVELPDSTTSVFASYALMMLKSPKAMRDGIIRRFFKRQNPPVLIDEGFLSILSRTLTPYFASSTRNDNILRFLSQLKQPPIFLIDEFTSIKLLNLKMLKKTGKIIYVSQDVAHNSLNFRKYSISEKLLYNLERDAVTLADLVISCSERDKLKYMEMGAKTVISYPNIYPIQEFEPDEKDKDPSVSIVLRGHWGPSVYKSLSEILKALSYVDSKLTVYLFGTKPDRVPGNVCLKFYGYIPNQLDYLKVLSKSWLAINIGIHMGGTNQRKYDYALAGTVVVSDKCGARGDILPFEFTYVDCHDLAAKIEQLLALSRETLTAMGVQNRKHSLLLAERQRNLLSEAIKEIVEKSC
jgi:hypothetical protein